MAIKPQGLPLNQTLLLLNLWHEGGKDQWIPRTQIRNRVSKTKTTDLDHLLEQGLVSQVRKKNILWQLTDAGEQALTASLGSPDLEFSTVIGKYTANALLHWIRSSLRVQSSMVSASLGTLGNDVSKPELGDPITTYEQFEAVTLALVAQLDRDYCLNNVVAIYRVRRILGDRLSRSQFNEWLLELQANDKINLLSGDMPELTADIAEDSIKTPLGYVRYYIELT